MLSYTLELYVMVVDPVSPDMKRLMTGLMAYDQTFINLIEKIDYIKNNLEN